MVRKHIIFETQKGNRAENEFEKDFYKFLVNSVFGNLLENVRTRLKIDFFKKI